MQLESFQGCYIFFSQQRKIWKIIVHYYDEHKSAYFLIIQTNRDIHLDKNG